MQRLPELGRPVRSVRHSSPLEHVEIGLPRGLLLPPDAFLRRRRRDPPAARLHPASACLHHVSRATRKPPLGLPLQRLHIARSTIHTPRRSMAREKKDARRRPWLRPRPRPITAGVCAFAAAARIRGLVARERLPARQVRAGMSPHQEGTGSAPFQTTRIIPVVSHGLRPLKLSYAGLPHAALHSPILSIAPPRHSLIASPSQPRSAATVCSAALLANVHDPSAGALHLSATSTSSSLCFAGARRESLDEDRLHSSGESPALLSRLLLRAGTDLCLLCRARTVPAVVLSTSQPLARTASSCLPVRPGGICPAYLSLRSACMAPQRHPHRYRARRYSTRSRRGGRTSSRGRGRWWR
ncbi:hypothetical protein DFH08DRAFT_350660 [Mycena albidolilacea]|uniref:Uncharacterized protein n=1 Tax=Mycena albidolilacea TaxID=1033008 RepID=A0AAD6ZIM2_9AGAR|nr:hypothetical protein DFH08DRAFT_350660 [Mycena albidolilacea]